MKLLTPPSRYDVFLKKEMVSAEERHIQLIESVRRRSIGRSARSAASSATFTKAEAER
jgi:hypothetical protein